MKLLLKVVALVWCAGIIASHAQLTDDLKRRLGGDPDADRARAAKIAREAPPPEVVAMRERIRKLVPTLTDNSMMTMQSNDPFLLELYRYRVGHPLDDIPWAKVIDRDLYRRSEAKDLMISLLSTQSEENGREGALSWVSKHTDLWWSVDVMEEGIKLCRRDPASWQRHGLGLLCHLISLRGDATHLPFLRESAQLGIDGGSLQSIERRIESGEPIMPFNIENLTPNGYKSPLPRPFQPRPKEFQVAKIDEVKVSTAKEHLSWGRITGVGLLAVVIGVLVSKMVLKKEPSKNESTDNS